MAYGTLRFLYDNFVVTADMITPGSQASGVVSGGQKTIGVDSAILASAGAYSGVDDLLYTVQIDSTTPGTEVGQATFRWRTSDTASGVWEASGVTTTSTFVTLNYGVTIAFTSGVGQDFSIGDTWIFQATAVFGPGKLIDKERNTLYRTAATMTTVIDLGSAQNVTAFALLDHNITSGGTLTLQGHTSDSWGAPSYSQAVTVQNPAYLYLDETYRYWRIVPVDGTVSYFQCGELFVGAYTELIIPNADWGSLRAYNYILHENESYTGLLRRKAYAQQHRLTLPLGVISQPDVTTLITMQDALIDVETGDVNPLFVHLFSDEADSLYFMDWMNIGNFEQELFTYPYNRSSLQFAEQVKTRI